MNVALIQLLMLTFLLVGTKKSAIVRIGKSSKNSDSILDPQRARTNVALVELLMLTFLLVGTKESVIGRIG